MKIDRDRIGFGFSRGGFTGLALVGGDSIFTMFFRIGVAKARCSRAAPKLGRTEFPQNLLCMIRESGRL